MKKTNLCQLSKDLRIFLALFLFTLSIGVILGILFLYQTTSFDKTSTVERFSETGVNIEQDFGIDESNSRSTGEMLMTTHNHIIGFSFIFFFVGGIFYFNSSVRGFLKLFLITEPFVSIILSFGSMWGIRYIAEEMIYITMISASLIYSSFFIMVAISLYELLLKRPS